MRLHFLQKIDNQLLVKRDAPHWIKVKNRLGVLQLTENANFILIGSVTDAENARRVVSKSKCRAEKFTVSAICLDRNNKRVGERSGQTQ
jgi:hypothetical protein